MIAWYAETSSRRTCVVIDAIFSFLFLLLFPYSRDDLDYVQKEERVLIQKRAVTHSGKGTIESIQFSSSSSSSLTLAIDLARTEKKLLSQKDGKMSNAD